MLRRTTIMADSTKGSCRSCQVCHLVDARKYLLQCNQCHNRSHAVCVNLTAAVAKTLPSWTCGLCATDTGAHAVNEPPSAVSNVDTSVSIPGPEDHENGNDVPYAAADRCNVLEIITSILKQNGRVLGRIPMGGRPHAAEILSNVINDLLDSDLKSEAIWIKLLSFAQCCLKVPRAGRKRNRRVQCATGDTTLTAKVNGALRIYAAAVPTVIDQPEQADRHKPRRATAAGHEGDDLSRRVSEKLSDYDVTGAVRITASNAKLIPPTNDVAELLRAKHPPAQPDRQLAPHLTLGMPPCPPLQATTEEVMASVQSFAKGAAGGADGLRPQHLKDMLGCEGSVSSQNLLDSLTRLTNHILKSGVPVPFKAVFFGANLIALRKPDDGVRPIAVGLTIRRLCSKVATRSVRDIAAQKLRPHQLGFGVAGGCEGAVHAAQCFLDTVANSGEPSMLLKVDLVNAFNNMSREFILKIIYEQYPGIYQYVQASYNEESQLILLTVALLRLTVCSRGIPWGHFCLP